MTNAERNPHYRAIAGTLELFLGIYFLDFGVVATLFFVRRSNLQGVLLVTAGALFGILLILRARRLLGWHRWIFWVAILVLTIVPILWLIPALVRFR